MENEKWILTAILSQKSNIYTAKKLDLHLFIRSRNGFEGMQLFFFILFVYNIKMETLHKFAEYFVC